MALSHPLTSNFSHWHSYLASQSIEPNATTRSHVTLLRGFFFGEAFGLQPSPPPPASLQNREILHKQENGGCWIGERHWSRKCWLASQTSRACGDRSQKAASPPPNVPGYRKQHTKTERDGGITFRRTASEPSLRAIPEKKVRQRKEKGNDDSSEGNAPCIEWSCKLTTTTRNARS